MKTDNTSFVGTVTHTMNRSEGASAVAKRFGRRAFVKGLAIGGASLLPLGNAFAADKRNKSKHGAITKGDVLAVARVAGIQAAKQTPHLLPLCHPLLVGAVLVNFRLEDTYVEVEANVDTVDRTGVEMEALTAAGIAALTIYDMCKSIDRSMTIGDLALWEKTGGRSGTWRRQSDGSDPFGL